MCTTNDRMNLSQCEKRAQREGYDRATFDILREDGQLISCKWLDAYFGLFTIQGDKKFITVKDMDELFPDLICTNFRAATD